MSSENTATSSKSLLIPVLAAFVAVLATVGCSSKPDSEPAAELLLYCGAGIRPPVEQLADAFAAEHPVKVILDFAGSEVLLSRIRLSGRGDLYMPGDAHYVDLAENAGFVLSRRSVAYWVPVILVRKGNPKAIRSLRDLLKDDVRVGLGDPNACAIGRTAQQLLEKSGIAWADVEKNLKFKSMTVNELGLQIQARSLDAVIVWDALARYYEACGDMIAIDPEDNIISPIDVAVLSFTRKKDLAERFAAFLTSDKAREVFAGHHYHTDKPLD
ncbi:MAG TPA: molybdate ABC transporter substrate-binding protein [Phycisphaerales bacterium]|nr:molybdate ABC transporter substrate-binding protein [Phycisphaerales bacterium]